MRARGTTASGSGPVNQHPKASSAFEAEARLWTLRTSRGQARSSIHIVARLDQMTRAKLEDLARSFHRSLAVVLRQIMQWGLVRGQSEKIDQGHAPAPVRHLYLYVDANLYQGVKKVVDAAGVKIAPWLRHMTRRITPEDFPESWQATACDRAGIPAGTGRNMRSHASRYYGDPFMFRPNETSRLKMSRKPPSSASSSPRQSQKISRQAGR